MKIIDLLQRGGPHFSFEYFPPKTSKGEETLFATISKMRDLSPSFVSVTCAAGGSTRGKTVDWARRIRDDLGLEAVVHLTCFGVRRDDLRQDVRETKEAGLLNILALRGDVPIPDAPADGCRYATDLIEVVREEYPEACIIAAAYPETHRESRTPAQDLDHLKRKVDAGADALITQLFFENNHFLAFRDRCEAAGIRVPIVPGLMPITSVEQVKRFTEMCGASFPGRLLAELDRAASDPQEVIEMGVMHAIAQCEGLLAEGVPGIHFYTLNRSPATRLVVSSLRRSVGVR